MMVPAQFYNSKIFFRRVFDDFDFRAVVFILNFRAGFDCDGTSAVLLFRDSYQNLYSLKTYNFSGATDFRLKAF